MKIIVECNYHCGTTKEVEIPFNIKDIKDYYVKWGEFNYTLNGTDWASFSVEGDPEVDWKRPNYVTVYSEGYEQELLSK